MGSRKLKAVIVIGAATLAVLGASTVHSDGKAAAYKMEGAWVGRVVEVPLQWSFVFSPDASGRRASARGAFEVGPPSYFGSTRNSDLLIEAEMTGPNAVAFSAVWYGLSEPSVYGLSADIVFIGVDTGVMTFVAPGKLLGVHNVEYYLPSQDADGDGFPDPGQEPVVGPELLHSVNMRIPAP